VFVCVRESEKERDYIWTSSTVCHILRSLLRVCVGGECVCLYECVCARVCECVCVCVCVKESTFRGRFVAFWKVY